MSRHWRPDRSDWSLIENYGVPERNGRRWAVVLVLGAVALGLAGGAMWERSQGSAPMELKSGE